MIVQEQPIHDNREDGNHKLLATNVQIRITKLEALNLCRQRKNLDILPSKPSLIEDILEELVASIEHYNMKHIKRSELENIYKANIS